MASNLTNEDHNVKTMKECGNMESRKRGNVESTDGGNADCGKMRISEMRTDVASTYVLRPRLGIWCP